MWGTIERGVEGLVVVVAVALLAGQALGQPVLLGYVRTGSMQPALAPGDGFVALPPAVVDDPEPGDVIVYRAQQVNGGGLTTHRVVRETERGYVTRGDANPFTDQAAGEPPVHEPQVAAVGLRVGGKLVAVPGLGTAVTAVRDATEGIRRRAPDGLLIGVGVAGLFALLAGGHGGSRGRTPVRERSGGHGRGRSLRFGARELVLVFGAVVLATATASMVLPLGPTEYEVVSSEADLPGPGVIQTGETETAAYRVRGGSLLPTRYYLVPASDGVRIPGESAAGVVPPGETASVAVRLSAPPDIGYYRRYVAEHRYPLALPRPVVDALYALNPLAPVVVLDTILAAPFALVARLLGGRARSRGSAGAETGLTRLLGGSRR
jgi:signal peptidase